MTSKAPMGPPIRFSRREAGKQVPWRVLDYEDLHCRASIVWPGEIVAPEARITIRFDYPLGEASERLFKADDPAGFTRLDFAQCICEGYRAIYAEEDEAFRDEAPTMPRILGVVHTTGPHGIHRYRIENLIVEGAFLRGPGVYELRIEGSSGQP